MGEKQLQFQEQRFDPNADSDEDSVDMEFEQAYDYLLEVRDYPVIGDC